MENNLIVEFASKVMLVDAVQQRLSELFTEVIRSKGTAHVLFSGGSTPGPIYQGLAHHFRSLSRIHIGLVDERFVETTSEFSNERLVRECFNTVKQPPNIVGMVHDVTNTSRNLMLLDKAYAPFKERIDFVLLGMGKDGHTASIFPEDPASHTAITSDLPFFTTNAPHSPKNRITCGRAFLSKAKTIYLVITGKEKRSILEDTSRNLPIHQFLDVRPDIQLFYAP